MNETFNIRIDREAIEKFCREHHIRKMALFGSVLRSDFRDESDVDILVEFDKDMEPGLIGLGSMESALSDIIGRPVEMRTPEDLSKLFRQEVISSAEVLYAD